MKSLFSNRVAFALRVALASWLGMACVLMPLLHTHAHHVPPQAHNDSDATHFCGQITHVPGTSVAEEASGKTGFCFACHWLQNLSKVAIILPELGWTPLISCATYQHKSSPAAYSRNLAIDARAPPLV